MSVTAALLFLALLQTALSSDRKSYEGYKILTVTPADQAAINTLLQIRSESAVDFWEEPTHVGVEVKFMVSPDELSRIEEILNTAGIAYTTAVDNVQRNISPTLGDINRKLTRSRSRHSGQIDLDDFNTLEDLYSFMSGLARRCPPGFHCKVVNIGYSYEHREIKMFKIVKTGVGRKGFWVDGTIHAREWLSTTTVIRILNHLATAADAESRRLIETYDWYIIPIINPDGYSFTWTHERYWRKNRHPSKHCTGVDLNRNFDYRWGLEGVSHNPCSEIYCGPSAGSEPETQVVSETLVQLAGRLAGMVTIHAYSSMWMFPWGHSVNYTFNGPASCDQADDYDDLRMVADAAADAVQSTYQTEWRRGSSCEIIYPTTGDSFDYAKAVAGIKHAYGLELRGDDFVVDKSNIPRSFREVWNGLVAMCDAISDLEQHQQQQQSRDHMQAIRRRVRWHH